MSNSHHTSARPESIDGPANNDVLVRAQQAIADHGQLRSRLADLEFEVNSEVLVVRGRVPSYYLKQLLQTSLKGVEGVERIENQVEVVAADPFDWRPSPG